MSDFYPRDYQADSINAIVNSVINPNQHLNPVVSAPTGSGKTIIGGWTIASLQSLKPESRILVVTHVKELVRQNARTMQQIIEQPIGIYSAGLRSETRKDPDLHWYDGHDVVCGSIGTIYNKTNKGLGKFDHIIVDEAHRVPDKVDTMYRTLLQDQGQIDGVYGGPHVIGLSATPFRLGKGLIYGPGELFTNLAHEIPIRLLIEEGHLTAPASVKSKTKIDFSSAKVRNGDFDSNDIERIFKDELDQIVDECIHHAGDRKKWILFASSIGQCEDFVAKLNDKGITSRSVHSMMERDVRDKNIKDFIDSEFKCLVNVSVLTEGFDCTDIDTVILARPTKSPGLYVQMCGRGLRLHEGKDDVMILDYGKNISRHGPIDAVRVKRPGPSNGKVPYKLCKDRNVDGFEISGCGHENPMRVEHCEECGSPFAMAGGMKLMTQPELLQHVLSTPMWMYVEKVDSEIYMKPTTGNKTVKLTYHCTDDFGNKCQAREWVAFESKRAKFKVGQWWKRRNGIEPVPKTVQEGLTRIQNGELTMPHEVQIGSSQGRYFEVRRIKVKRIKQSQDANQKLVA